MEKLDLFSQAAVINLSATFEDLNDKEAKVQLLLDMLLHSDNQHGTMIKEDNLHSVMLPFLEKALADVQTLKTDLKEAMQLRKKLNVTFVLPDVAESNAIACFEQFLKDLQRATIMIQSKPPSNINAQTHVKERVKAIMKEQSTKMQAFMATAGDNDRNMVEGLLGAIKT